MTSIEGVVASSLKVVITIFWTVKGNQPQLLQDLQDWFDDWVTLLSGRGCLAKDFRSATLTSKSDTCTCGASAGVADWKCGPVSKNIPLLITSSSLSLPNPTFPLSPLPDASLRLTLTVLSLSYAEKALGSSVCIMLRIELKLPIFIQREFVTGHGISFHIQAVRVVNTVKESGGSVTLARPASTGGVERGTATS